VTQEENQPVGSDTPAEAQQPSDTAEPPMNRAERRAMAKGKKGPQGNTHTVNVPGQAKTVTSRGPAVPPQQHTRSSNRGK